jgi:hypothetical protein
MGPEYRILSERIGVGPKQPPSEPEQAGASPLRLAAVFAASAALSLVLLEPGLALPFFSDDVPVVAANEHVHGLSARNLAAILDPAGAPARDTKNYAPVHLLAHALEWSLWGPDVRGYHLVNLLVHALVVTLLVALLCARGLPFAGAALAGLVFALHPANVETVLWIFQLKTLLALLFALAALLAHPRRPGWATACFGLALLAKIPALFALAVAAVWTFRAPPDRPEWRRNAPWLLAWTAVALLCGLAQLAVFERGGEIHEPLAPDLPGRIRALAMIGCRYLVMAFTGIGVSPFHEPDLAVAWTDPWWLGGLLLGALLAWRLLASLLARREEAGWWLWAAAAYAPVSQVYRFLFPMGDRYLYLVLPGLIGGVVFAVRDAWPALAGALAARGLRLPARPHLLPAAAAAAGALAVAFGALTAAQARVWRSPSTISLATARNYPDGITAHYMRAVQAARRGDAATAARELRGALARGFDAFMELESDPTFTALRGHPDYDAVLRDIAADWIATIEVRPDPTYYELYWTAEARWLRGELEAAEATYRRALALGGGFDPAIRERLLTLDRLRGASAGGPAPDGG